jgi:hypothetical protein
MSDQPDNMPFSPPRGSPPTASPVSIGPRRRLEDGNWFWLDNSVIDLVAKVGPTAFSVYVYLVRRSKGTPRTCFPSHGKIAEDLGFSYETAKRSIADLGQAGAITIDHKNGKGNTYTIIDTLVTSDQGHTRPGSDMTRDLGHQRPGTLVTSDPLRKTQEGRPNKEENSRSNGKAKKSSPNAKKFVFSDEDMTTAQWMFDLVLQVIPNEDPPKSFGEWANCIRLIRERDRRTDEQIRSLFTWANGNDFWRAKVRCPEKLRDKWKTLNAQQLTEPNGRRNGRQSHYQGAGVNHDPNNPLSDDF